MRNSSDHAASLHTAQNNIRGLAYTVSHPPLGPDGYLSSKLQCNAPLMYCPTWTHSETLVKCKTTIWSEISRSHDYTQTKVTNACVTSGSYSFILILCYGFPSRKIVQHFNPRQPLFSSVASYYMLSEQHRLCLITRTSWSLISSESISSPDIFHALIWLISNYHTLPPDILVHVDNIANLQVALPCCWLPHPKGLLSAS